MHNFRREKINVVSEQGFALVVVIVVMLLASFLASQLILLVRTELKISQNIQARVVGHFLAEAGLSLGLFRILEPGPPAEIPEIGVPEDWEQRFYEGYEYEVYLPKGKVTYYAGSETGKIDLNSISRPSNRRLMKLFLEYQLGEGQEEQINDIIASILDWTDNDDFYRDTNGRGAESETYGELDDPYIARNGKMEDPAEFFLVKGTEVMAGKFFAHEFFTVHNKNGKINFNSLTPAMLDFLTRGAKDRKIAYREAKKEFKGRITIPSVVAEILGEEQYDLLSPYLTDSAGNNKYYYIVGTGYAGVEKQENLDEGLIDEESGEGPPKKRDPGTVNSLLIKKNRSDFAIVSWQQRYT